VDIKAFEHGVRLFNEGEYFEAHEVWEDVWRAASAEQKKLLQGLIQIAVALHHHSTGNTMGARSLLDRGSRNLNGGPRDFCPLDIESLLREIRLWQTALETQAPLPAAPKLIRLSR